MLKRTITGAFITAAVYLVLYFSYIPVVLTCATTVLAAFSVYEIYHAAGYANKKALLILSLLATIGLTIWELPYYEYIIPVTFVMAVIIFAGMILFQKKCKIDHYVKAAVLALLVLLLYQAYPVLRKMEHGLYYLGGAITLCFITDVAAYLVGKSFGKHKLIPSVSPNKTVEGSVAGVFFAALIMLLIGIVFVNSRFVQINYPLLVVYVAFASGVGQFGDLAMSVVKRICGVKDFGNIFPGHGGMLDRFDSHIFAVAFTLIFCYLTGGYIL